MFENPSASTSPSYPDKYINRESVHAPVKSAATGAKSANTIPATVTRTVPKREVIGKVFQNGKAIGSKVLTRGLPFVGQAILAWELVDAVAKLKGYNWSDDYRNWVKPGDKTVRYIMRTSNPTGFNADTVRTHKQIENWCNKRSSSGKSRDCSLPQLTTATGEQLGKAKLNLCGSSKITIHGGGKPRTEVVTADRLDEHRYCAKGIYTFDWGVVEGVLDEKYLPLTEEEFVKIAEPSADEAPGKWVKAAKPETLNWSKPEVLVQNGMVAQSSPYTNAKGEAEQTRWTFYTPQGATASTAKEELIARPDLKPDSPTAPALEPLPKTETDTPASAPADDKRQSPAESDLCDKYPNILACDEVHDANDKDDEIELPEKEINLTFDKDSVFDEKGRCPAPVQFTAFGKTFGFSLEYVCQVGRRLRPILIALAWVFAAMFAIRTVRSV